MATNYEYILSLKDQMSGTMSRITGSSAATISKLSVLSDKVKALKDTTAELGGSIFNLKQKMDLLQQEKELLDPANLAGIKQYNKEIAELAKEIDRLDNAGNGGKLKGYFGEIGGMVKGIFNPVTIGAAAIGFAGKSAMNFNEGMAKVNITAQLDETGLSDLKKKLKSIAKENKADITVVPNGFEKIISQTGDVDASLQILDASLKGSKAGFTDLDTVTGALAQTLSIVGTKNASAQEVLDTFFAAKRVGAGEFKDFANYMPGLIAGADALGMNYKSVAGTFAYMTGKGQDAARASVLMGNMFSVLQKTDITANLKKAGIQIFDNQGKMRGMVNIFGDLNRVMAGMNDEQKSGFLEKIGIVDKEAKSAFAIMSGDIEKLTAAMDATANSTGETTAALELSKNPVQTATELWNQFKGIGLQVGELILPAISVGLNVLGYVLNGVNTLLTGAISFFSGWMGYLQEGNPLIWGLTAALGALTVALVAYEIITNKAALATQAKAMWDGIVGGATKVWTTAQWLLNASLYACPLVWIVAAIGAVVAAIVWAWNSFEGFRKVVMGVWEVIKTFGDMLFNSVVSVVRNLIDGLGALGRAISHLFKGEFKAAVAEAKDGAQKMWDANPLVATVKTVTKTDFSGAWDKGTQAGADSWQRSLEEKADKAGNPAAQLTTPPPGIAMPEVPATANYTDLMKKLGTGKGSGKGKKTDTADTLDLNSIVQQTKGSTAYGAIASRLATVKMPSLAKMAATVALPLAVASTAPGGEPMGLPTQSDHTEYADSRKNITMERFCDSIVINIANADGKGHHQIRQEIETVLKQVIDNQG